MCYRRIGRVHSGRRTCVHDAKIECRPCAGSEAIWPAMQPNGNTRVNFQLHALRASVICDTLTVCPPDACLGLYRPLHPFLHSEIIYSSVGRCQHSVNDDGRAQSKPMNTCSCTMRYARIACAEMPWKKCRRTKNTYEKFTRK